MEEQAAVMAPHDGSLQLTHDDLQVCLDLNELSEEMLERARLELGETPEIRTKTLIELRNLISERGDLACRTDDEFLLRFLRSRRFHVEAAYKLLQNYFNFKASRPELHDNVCPQKLDFLGNEGVLSVPPYKDQDDRRLIFYRVGKWSPSKYKVTELLKASVVVLEIGVLEHAVTVTGGVCIFDLSGISLSHAWNITPSVAETIVDLLVRSFPIRIHAIHVVNQPYIFSMIFAMFKPLLDKKMQERIHFHGSDMSSLHRHVSPKHLPKCYGGIHEEYSYRLWMDYLTKKPEVMHSLRRLGYEVEDQQAL